MWLSQSLDLNPIDFFFTLGFKLAVHDWKPSNVDELKQVCN